MAGLLNALREGGIVEDTKLWWMSRGVLGGVATIVAGLAGLAGYVVDAAALTQVLLDAAVVGAGAVSVYGRIAATQIIQKK